jgi:hypothetical protein
MSDALVLFCGGPAIYSGAPKPLQKLVTGETLIERYLNHIQPRVPSQVVLLVDQSFEDDYSSTLQNVEYPAEITILACADNSSTFDKLHTFLKSDYPAGWTVIFSYPDVFVIGDVDAPSVADPRLCDNAFVSFSPVVSRFPRLMVDAYGSTVQGISNHTSLMPANPVHVFGGHLLVRTDLMNTLVDTFLAEVIPTEPSLEFDLFFWLINTMRMQSMQIHGRWIHADSVREVEIILGMTCPAR